MDRADGYMQAGRGLTAESTWSCSRLVPQNGTSHLERRPTARPFPGSFRWHSTRSRKPIFEFGWLQCGGEQEVKDSSEEESERASAITEGNR